jgi:hypothetical protein
VVSEVVSTVAVKGKTGSDVGVSGTRRRAVGVGKGMGVGTGVTVISAVGVGDRQAVGGGNGFRETVGLRAMSR